MKVNNMHEFVKKNKQCCFRWLGFCNFWFFSMLNNSVLLKYYNAKPKQMKLSVDSRLAQHWTFLLCDNEVDDEQRATDSLSSLNAGFTPNDSQGPRRPTNCSASSQPERRPRLTWKCSQGTNRLVDLQYCPSNLLETSIWCVSLSLLSVCLSDRPPYHNCTPRDCSEITFLVNLIFFLSGLTFH